MRSSFFTRGRHGRLAILVYRALHLAVPALLVAAVLAVVGAQDVLSRLAMAEPVWVCASLAACSLQVLLSALRWRLTAARLDVVLPIERAVGEYYLSSLINVTVPGGVVGDAMRAVRTRDAAGLEKAAQAVMIERLAGQVALAAVLVLGLALSGQPMLQWTAAFVMGGAATLGVIGLAARTFQWGRVLPPVILRFLAALRHSWFDRRVGPLQVGLSLLIVAANLAAFVFAVRAVGVALTASNALLAVPLILGAMLIPLSIAGWGYRETAAAAVFPLIGASAASGVAASVVFGAVVLVASLPGLVVVLLRLKDPVTKTHRPSAVQSEVGHNARSGPEPADLAHRPAQDA